jgi:hypothetical protein
LARCRGRSEAEARTTTSPDNLGSVADVVASDGTAEWSYTYEPCGTLRAAVQDSPSRRRTWATLDLGWEEGDRQRPDAPVEAEEYGALLLRKGTRPWADVDREG